MKSKLFLGLALCGMLSSDATIAYAGNLIVDSSFELGSPDWVLTGSSGFTFQTAGESFGHTDIYSAYVNCLALPCPGAVTQTVDTAIGDEYSVDFWLTSNGNDTFVYNNDGFGAGAVSVAFGNAVGYLQTSPFATPDVWQEFDFTMTATSLTTDFAFSGYNMGGTVFIDDVSVTDLSSGPGGAPEPSTLFTGAGALLIAALVGRRRAQPC